MMPIPLKILLFVILKIKSGQSLLSAIKQVSSLSPDSFTRQLKVWLLRFENGKRGKELTAGLGDLTRTPSREALVLIFEQGLCGSPIGPALKTLTEEFLYQTELAYERHLQMLPLKMLGPLLLGFFPAVLVLLIGPAFYLITHQLGAP